MATAQELAQNIGKTGTLRVSGTQLTFSVQILDARSRYGNLDYKSSRCQARAKHGTRRQEFPSRDISGEHMFGEQVFGLITGKGLRV